MKAGTPRATTTVTTPFATLEISTDGRAVTGVRYRPASVGTSHPADEVAALAVEEIGRYLDDPSFAFSVPIRLTGLTFHRKVWDAISRIPPGEARTYGALARELDTEARAIGQACGANPIPLFVPCHRVVGAGGSLGGFMGRRDPGVREPDLFATPDRDSVPALEPAEIKRWLLAHEGYRFGG